MRYKSFAILLLVISTLLLWGCDVNNVEMNTVQRFVIIKSDDWVIGCCPPSISESQMQMDNPAGYDGFVHIVNKHSVPVTFGILGNSVERSQEFFRYLVTHGHEIGNHTFDHPNLINLFNAEGAISVRTNITKTHEKISNEVCSKVSPTMRSNCTPSTFFPTFNVVNEAIIQEVVDAGYKHIFLYDSRPRSDIKVLPIGCPGVSGPWYTLRFDSNAYKEAGDVPLCVVEVHPNHWGTDTMREFENMIIFLKAQGVQIVTPKQFFGQVTNSDVYLSQAYEMQKTYAISQDHHMFHEHPHPH